MCAHRQIFGKLIRIPFFLSTIIFSSAAVFFPSFISAHDRGFKPGGYIKSLVTVTDYTGMNRVFPGDTPSHDESWTNLLRIRMNWFAGEYVTGEIAYEIAPSLQDAYSSRESIHIQAADPFSYRISDFDETIYPSDQDTSSSFEVLHNLDRLFLTFSPDSGDFHIGRQAIAFGSARAVNPTDILTSFSSTSLNTEERIGVDAIRIRIPMGSMSEIDSGLVFGEDFDSEENAFFLRTRFSLFKTDITPIGMVFKENLMMGIDITRSVGGAGFWFEGAHTVVGSLRHRQKELDYTRISSGFDYSFTENLYAFLEYHYNGAGMRDPEDYVKILEGIDRNTAYKDGAVYLLGMHYLASGLSYQITPLTIFHGRMFYNFNDYSFLLSPTITYSVSDNTEFETGAFVGFGEGSETVREPSTGISRFQTSSEFGLYPDTYFITARFYF